ncbi:hypothetical protein [uncultured Maribacter sp.]|uniref:hypothetical protein n=1 Tax=uncultured Maribacter sp. TaxID=431308 RepID=UPI002613DE70|nr:hypothetical protein [uncultured Maribacter sp.]
MRHTLGERIESLKFEVDYVKPIEQVQKELYLEEHAMKQDNTRVKIPKIFFNTGY